MKTWTPLINVLIGVVFFLASTVYCGKHGHEKKESSGPIIIKSSGKHGHGHDIIVVGGGEKKEEKKKEVRGLIRLLN